MEQPSAYIPMDRRQALVTGRAIPEQQQGAALFADISGFTPLTEALSEELGARRGAEELTTHLNRVYDALITELHRYGGSVMSFAGDAITCWLDGDDGRRATACALAMQRLMGQFASITIPSGRTISLAMKAAVASGATRRFLVGDPEIQIIDVLAGATLNELADAEAHANKGEVVLAPSTAAALQNDVTIAEWRAGEAPDLCYGVAAGMTGSVAHTPWPELPAHALTSEQIRPWLLPAVHERLQSGQGEFLAELRSAVSLFLRFGGIDYDQDEQAPQKLNRFIQTVQRTLIRFDGTLLQLTIGDKGSYLYASFGAPVAHEDDAVRAVSAALALQDVTDTLPYISSVQIGIASGRLRTGAYGGTTRRTYGVMGDTVNLAARLMQAAVPGQVLASQDVYQASRAVFNWDILPGIKVKGKRDLIVPASLVSRNERASIRLQEPRYTLPMVGRAAELDAIREKLALARQGQGQIVGITGEAGMGKSRLLAEVLRHAAEQGFSGYGGECQSFATNTSYYAWQEIWRGFFGLQSGQPPAEQLAALTAVLQAIDPSLLPRLPLLGTVVGLSIPDTELTRSFDAKLRKSSLESLLVDCLRARITHPTFLVVEDTHWLDPLSNDLLEAVGRALTDLPIVLVLSYRPATQARLQEARLNALPHFTEIALTDFSQQEAEQLIRLKIGQIYGGETAVPATLITLITTRADGNPFYIEELLNYLQDRGTDLNNVRSLETLELPDSLHSLILSRIDQLSESQKGTIKVASVIGRLFKASTLWGVYPQLGAAQQIQADLDVLSQLDLTPMDTPEPELTYLFKNVVTQEVAYENLPFAMRAALHEQIGRYLEETSADSLEQSVDLLAFHYERSHNVDKKRTYLLMAGEVAQANYANEAAIDYYQRALPLLPDAERITILLKLGDVLHFVGRWSEAGEQYEAALQLSRRVGDVRGRAWSQTAIGEHLRKQGLYDEADRRLRRARLNFEELGDRAGVGQVLHNAGTLAAQRGDYNKARSLYEESLAIRRELGDDHNIGSLLSNMGIVARFQGDFDTARSLYEDSLAIRRRIGDRWAIAVSLNNLGLLALHVGDLATARQRLEETVLLQREVGGRLYLANGLHDLANVTREQGDYPAARLLYLESLQINKTLGDSRALAFLLEDISCLALAEAQPERALRLYAAASALRQAIGAPLPPGDREKLDGLLGESARRLDPARQTAVRAEGATMSVEQAISYAMEMV